MSGFLRMMNSIKQTNIQLVKFKKKFSEVMFERYLLKKQERIKKLNQKLKSYDEIDENQYFKAVNSVW